jgi:type IV pilus assembly protein PilB
MDYLLEFPKKDIVSKDVLQTVRTEKRKKDKALDAILQKHGITREQILSVKSDYYGVPSIDIANTSIPHQTLQIIPQESSRHYKIIPLEVNDDTLEVGFVDPDNRQALDAVQFIANKRNLTIEKYVITESDFRERFEDYESLSGEVSQALDDLETELSSEEKQVSEDIEAISEESDETVKEDESGKKRIVEDAPVTKIVATILQYATEGGASDVHIEPMEERIRVRFRVSGTLHTSLQLPTSVKSAVVARIKILSELKLDERRKPQDGRFSAHIQGRKVDFRVSTFPTYYGEKVVMRILDPEQGDIPLEDLGMTKRNYNLVKDAITQPHGMILISGPTGSGKTTTLYSMLKDVDTDTQNVLSLEDPVEYKVPGINQSQVQPEIGYTFANGLRTTLRQDPDIIMVGEIRDEETAGLAIQAALTGHLVMSTIHTNSAAGIIPRLIDMGVDPYLIPPTLVLGIAQRLVKTMCDNAGKKVPTDGSIEEMIEGEFEDLPDKYRKEIEIPEYIYRKESAPGCPSGLRGRSAVFEMFSMTKEVEEVILNNPNDTAIYEAARKDGMLTMREDALLKAFEGEVPLEQVNTLRR